MATVKEVLTMLNNFAPEEHVYKQEYDNIGLLFGEPHAQVNKVLVCLDATEAVLDEAIATGSSMIVSHHPFIYAPIKRINSDDLMGRKILKAARAGLNIYSAHTNLDFVKDGINEYLAVMMHLHNIMPLQPYISPTEGFGRVGDLTNKVYANDLALGIEALLNDSLVRVVAPKAAQVRRVAIINGGGGGDTKYIDMALAAGADCLITADVKHHVAVYAKEMGLTLIEPQHYTMEHVYIARLVQVLKIEAKSYDLGIEIIQAKSETNPRTGLRQ